MYYGGKRMDKTLEAVVQSKIAQKSGKRVWWATLDQPATAEFLSRHGALSEIVGKYYVAPRWPKSKLDTEV
jgi:hypothetical protein